MIEHDWLDHEFIEQPHGRLRGGRRARDASGRRGGRPKSPASPRSPSGRPPSGGEPRRPAFCCTRAASSTTATACRTCWARSTSCWPPGASAAPNCGYATITGQAQRPGRPRARPEVRSASRRARPRQPRAPRPRRRRLGHRSGRAARSPASTPTRSSARSTAARSRACCRSASTRSSRCRTTTSCAQARQARLLRRDRLLPERNARATPTSCCPARCRKRTRAPSRRSKGRVIKINKAVDCPGDARQDWRIIQDIAAGARPRARLHVRRARARSSTSCAWPRRAASPTTPASPTRRSRRTTASSGRARASDSIRAAGTPRLFEPGSWNPVAKGAGPFYFPDGKARFNVDAVRAAGRRRRRRVSRSS